MTRHAAPGEMLLDYVAGTLPEGPALIVATQAALVADVRASIAALTAAGGALLDALPPAALDEAALDAVMARLDEAGPADAAPPRPVVVDGVTLPAPLARALGDRGGWRGFWPGVREMAIPLADGVHRVALMRIAAGRSIPAHRHGGVEYTLVLDGGFVDGRGRYERGDLCVATPETEHRPVADAHGACLCLAVSQAPIAMTGPLARLLNPFLRR